MTNINLEFYESLVDSTAKQFEQFKGQVDRANADRDEAIALASELEETVALKDARIAQLEAENAELKTGFESDEVEKLKAIAVKLEQLHNAASSLTNPVKEEPETEEVEEVVETEEEIEETDDTI